jgi:TATA-box binding protein (TBP) (component of TFIID and TFIIIB)
MQIKKIKRLQSPELRIVNTVWKGNVLAPVLLSALNIACECGVVMVRHQKSQPEQYIVKFDNHSTMLIFKSGKFRVMGSGDTPSTILNILSVTNQFTPVLPIVSLQTMTGVYGYDRKIHLDKLCTATSGYLDLENFPAVQIRKFSPVHVNVFASGCVTICGLKTIDYGHVIKAYIDSIIDSCYVV